MNNVYPTAPFLRRSAPRSNVVGCADWTAQIRTVLAIIVKHGLPFDPVNRQ
jgi:hypothetical protein